MTEAHTLSIRIQTHIARPLAPPQKAGPAHLHVEVGSGGRSHGLGVPLRLHVVVDQPPLLQEAVHTQDGPHVTGQVAPAGRHTEILCWVQPKTVHHEVTVGDVAVRAGGWEGVQE